MTSNPHLLLFGMYFLPDLMLRLLVEEVMRSLSAAEAEEGTIMDWLMMLAGAVGPGEVARSPGEPEVIIMSPVMDCDIIGGSSPTPAMLELSPATITNVKYGASDSDSQLENMKKS